MIFNNLIDDNQGSTPLGAKNYALVSEHYFNFFTRLGYHFSRIDAFTSEEQNRNFINFNFRGGAAGHLRKIRRAKTIERILRHYNFDVTSNEDNVIASIRKITKEDSLFFLQEIGRLMGAVRNTDVTMLSDRHIDIFVEGFLEGDPAPARRYFNEQ